MKTLLLMMFPLALATVTHTPRLCAQLSIPNEGSDGEVFITSKTVIDRSRAVVGAVRRQ